MPNGNERGNTRDRQRRKMWLLATFGRHLFRECAGRCVQQKTYDCWVAQCWQCSTLVTYYTMVVDRIIPKILGGRYTRDNIQIHCPTCSHKQGQRIMRQRKNEPGRLSETR